MKSEKGASGQSQLLIPLIIVLGSVIALAANTTISALNSTNGSSITGALMGMPQVDANLLNTSISLEIIDKAVRATLALDNGTLLENEQLDFYLNDSLLGSGTTNAEGFVDFPIDANGNLKVAFNGDSLLNPSVNESTISGNELTFINETPITNEIVELVKTEVENLTSENKPLENLGIIPGTGSKVGEVSPSNEIKIERQDYVDKYFNWQFTELNDTYWIASFTINQTLWNDVKACLGSSGSRQTCFQNLCSNYLSDYLSCSDIGNRTKLGNDLSSMVNYPLANLTSKISFSNKNIDLINGKGSFYIIFPEGFREGERAKFGFGSTVIGTTTSTGPFYSPMQKRLFYAQGRFWDFYYNGTHMVWRTSTDAVTWSLENLVNATATNPGGFAVTTNGTHVHYADTNGSSPSAIYYRMGTLNTGGTISWLADRQTVLSQASGYFNMLTIALNTSDYPWIGFRNYSTSCYPFIISSKTNDGTWTMDQARRLSSTGSTNEYYVVPVPLSNGNMYVVYARSQNSAGDSNKNINGQLYNGSWQAEETIATDLCDRSCDYVSGASAVAQGNDIHVAYENTSRKINYINRTFATSSWGGSATIASVGGSNIPALSIFQGNNTLYAFWADNTTGSIYYKKYYQGAWDASPTTFVSGAANWFITNSTITASYSNYSYVSGGNTYNYISFGWVNKTASPYNVMHEFLNFSISSSGTSFSNCAVLDQNNTLYKLSASFTNTTAISCINITGFNDTLDCQGYTMTGGNNHFGIEEYWPSNQNTNNTIKNCILLNWSVGIYFYYASNNTFTNNAASNNTGQGFTLTYSDNNTLTNNRANNNTNTGFNVLGSNNSLVNNIANFNFVGIGVSGGSNTLINNTAHNNAYGIDLSSGSSNTIITNGSTAASSTTDYYLISAGATNNFTNTNFTAARKILLDDINSWFNYANDTTPLWLRTNNINGHTLTRTLNNWTNTNISWNESDSSTDTANYTINGLLTNVNYLVYNFSTLAYTINSGASGSINFNIPLNATSRTIEVVTFVTNLSDCAKLNAPNTVYYLTGNIGTGSDCCMNITAKNVTLDCQGFTLTGGGSNSGICFNSGQKGVYQYSSNDIVKNCSLTGWGYGVIFNYTENNTLDKVSVTNSLVAIFADTGGSNNNTLSNLFINAGSTAIRYGLSFETSSYNVLRNITSINARGGIRVQGYNDLKNLTAYSCDNGIQFYGDYNNLTNFSSYNNNNGIQISGSGNNITGGSIASNIIDYYISSGSNNNFTSTNFTDSRTISLSSNAFRYNNQTNGNIFIETNVSTAMNITRKLINWNSTLLDWNDTNNTEGMPYYTIYGMNANKLYFVYNDSVLAWKLQSDSSGNLGQFNITFGNAQKEIRVQQDESTPTYSNNASSTVSTYTPTGYSNFSITWNDNSGSVNAYLENNFSGSLTNTSMSGSYPNYFYNSSVLGANTYQYRFVANDSSGNTNATPILTFTISKAANPVNLYLNNSPNQNRTTTYPDSFNATATATIGTVNLYRNNVSKATGSSPQKEEILLGNGTYEYRVNATGNANYSDNTTGIAFYAKVNKGNAFSYLKVYIDGAEANKTINYPTTSNASANESASGDSDCTYTLNRNGTALISGSNVWNVTTLGNGTYMFNYSMSGTCTNWTLNTSQNLFLYVNKGTLTATLYLNGSQGSQTSTYPNSTINVTATSSVSGLYVQIWRTNASSTLLDNVTSTSWNVTQWGAYNNNFSAQVLGNQNYSSSALVFLWWNVSKGVTNTTLFLNNTQGNNTYSVSNVANFTVNLNVSKTVNLYSNYTGWLLQTVATPLMNYTTLNAIGKWWNLTGYFSGDENYSASSQTYWFNVTDGTPPTYSSNSTNNTRIGRPTLFSLNWSDNIGLSGYVFSIKTNDLEDNFDDSSIDTTKWTNVSSQWNSLSESNGFLNLTSQSAGSAILMTNSSYKIQNRTVQIEVLNHSTDSGLKISATYGNGAHWPQWDIYEEQNYYNFHQASSTQVSAQKQNGGSPSTLATSPTLKAPYWLRYRFNQTYIFFDYANYTDTVTSESQWVNLYNESWGIGTAMSSNYYVFLTAYDTPTTGSAAIDNFEIVENENGSYFTNNSFSTFSGTWSNVTKNTPSVAGALIRWCVYANDTSNNWNGTSCSNPFMLTTTANVSFLVTLPNNIAYSSSVGTTADEEFNATASTIANVSPYVRATTYKQNSTVVGDATNIANFIVNNTGDYSENITMCINASLSSKIAVWGTRSNNPYSSPGTIPACSAGSWIANSSLSANVIDQFWIWTNFTGSSVDDSTVRELYINATA